MEDGFSRGDGTTMHLAPQHHRTFMVTCVCAERRRLFQVDRNAGLLREVLTHYAGLGRYELHAYVVMPDHIHILITPAADVSLEKAVQLIKGGFSFRLRGQREVWERGRFDRRVPDLAAFEAHVAYLHANPVRARLVARADLYPYSSASRPELVTPCPAWLQPGLKP